jgi:hypothetical protein
VQQRGDAAIRLGRTGDTRSARRPLDLTRERPARRDGREHGHRSRNRNKSLHRLTPLVSNRRPPLGGDHRLPTVTPRKACGQSIRNHLRPYFGDEDLARLSQRPEAFERYAGEKIADGLSPKTVRNHLTLLGLVFRSARKWRWVAENPLELVDKPPAEDAETETLTADEVALLLDAYRELAVLQAAEHVLPKALEPGKRGRLPEPDAWWFDVARRMTVVGLSTGLRRGEQAVPESFIFGAHRWFKNIDTSEPGGGLGDDETTPEVVDSPPGEVLWRIE